MEDNKLITKDKQEVRATGEHTKSGVVFTPEVDIYENEEALVLIADMPGVGSEDVDIHLEDDELWIRGKVAETKYDNPILEEYRVGDYARKFSLSNLIDQGKIEAVMKDGVLRVVLPKAEAAKPRKIAIQAG